MTKHSSLLKELIQRRVPQIVGLYIAATWMMIEIGDWLSQRFQVSSDLTSYIFIGMTVLIPSVILLAYQYGQPGRDPWKKTTFVVLPSNILASVAAMMYLVTPVVATEMKTVVDEQGQAQVYEIPKSGFHKQLVGFFWKNNSNNPKYDWMQQTLPWLLMNDLSRSIFVDGYTPFSSSSMIEQIKKSGYDHRQSIPLALQLNMANDRFADFAVNGEFDFDGQQFALTTHVYRVKTGQKVASQEHKGTNLLELVDLMSRSIEGILDLPRVINQQTIPISVAEHVSGSLIALEYFSRGMQAKTFDNNFVEAEKWFKQAVDEDFSFTQSRLKLAGVMHMMGRTQDALAQLTEALNQEFKLTAQEKFKYRGLLYALKGDYENQLKVNNMWLELFPDDVEGLEGTVNILLLTGLDHPKALAYLSRLRELVPEDDRYLNQIALLFILTGKLDKALEAQQLFVSRNQQNSTGWLRLANIQTRMSHFEKARKSIERVLILAPDDFTARSQLISLDLRVGNYPVALSEIQALQASESNPAQLISIGKMLQLYYSQQGKINETLRVLDESVKYFENSPYVLKVFNVDYVKSFLLVSVGQYDLASQILRDAEKQLQPPMNQVLIMGDFAIHFRRGEIDLLKQKFNQFNEFVNKNPNPLMTMGITGGQTMIYQLEGKYKEAIPLAEKNIASMTSSIVNNIDESGIIQMKIELARLKHLAGDSLIAIDELNLAIEQYPAFALAHLRLAEIYFDLGQFEQCRDALEAVFVHWVDADPDYFEFQNYQNLKQKINPQ